MILLIDNYDSFTFNLYQYFGELDEEVVVKRNDEITSKEIKKLDPDAMVLSAGPGIPEEAGNCPAIVETFHQSLPVFGIGLGAHIIGSLFGAERKKAEKMRHGKTVRINHSEAGLFAGLENPLEVMCYHSFVLDKKTLTGNFDITASTVSEGEVMAFKHQQYPLYGLQFHPESIGTKAGKELLKNFITMIGRGVKR